MRTILATAALLATASAAPADSEPTYPISADPAPHVAGQFDYHGAIPEGSGSYEDLAHHPAFRHVIEHADWFPVKTKPIHAWRTRAGALWRAQAYQSGFERDPYLARAHALAWRQFLEYNAERLAIEHQEMIARAFGAPVELTAEAVNNELRRLCAEAHLPFELTAEERADIAVIQQATCHQG